MSKQLMLFVEEPRVLFVLAYAREYSDLECVQEWLRVCYMRAEFEPGRARYEAELFRLLVDRGLNG